MYNNITHLEFDDKIKYQTTISDMLNSFGYIYDIYTFKRAITPDDLPSMLYIANIDERGRDEHNKLFPFIFIETNSRSQNLNIVGRVLEILPPNTSYYRKFVNLDYKTHNMDPLALMNRIKHYDSLTCNINRYTISDLKLSMIDNVINNYGKMMEAYPEINHISPAASYVILFMIREYKNIFTFTSKIPKAIELFSNCGDIAKYLTYLYEKILAFRPTHLVDLIYLAEDCSSLINAYFCRKNKVIYRSMTDYMALSPLFKFYLFTCSFLSINYSTKYLGH